MALAPASKPTGSLTVTSPIRALASDCQGAAIVTAWGRGKVIRHIGWFR